MEDISALLKSQVLDLKCQSGVYMWGHSSQSCLGSTRGCCLLPSLLDTLLQVVKLKDILLKVKERFTR
ncbi:hypothetical protein TNCT_28321 [Trichonephila clavata]|uniref:Uncharacterized protein n=1 Tax=Trichonephila clavata TaxID=2740835 RepID=A0A8X6LX21_TRICU|nr:hypothetical protein TNCT_28321 [Trichonephila clavata]